MFACTYSIGDIEDGVVVLQTFDVLDLTDNLDSLSFLSEDVTDLKDIRGLSHERGGDEVDLVGDTPILDVVDILVGECGEVHNNSWQVHVLALANAGVVFDAARNLTRGLINGEDGKDKTSISDKDLLSNGDRSAEGLVGTGELLAVSLVVVVGGENEGFSLDQLDLLGSIGKKSGSDFGSLGIQQDGCRLSTEAIADGKKRKLVSTNEKRSEDIVGRSKDTIGCIQYQARVAVYAGTNSWSLT